MHSISERLTTNYTQPINPVLAKKTTTFPETNRVWGAFLAFLGLAVKVQHLDGSIKYHTIDQLKNKFFTNRIKKTAGDAEAKLASKDKIIHNLFLSTINPLRGEAVKWEHLEKFNKGLRKSAHYSSSHSEGFYASLRNVRASIHSKKGMTTNQKKFINNIQLGDIIFHRTDDKVHSDIVDLQKFARAIGFSPKHRDAVHHNHVYICAKVDKFGKKWFAEAAWPSGKLDEIRLISEDDAARCFIKQDHGAISEIFRCRDHELARNAAKEARKVTTLLPPEEGGSEAMQPTELRYSIEEGARALFSSNSFGHFAKMRLFQQVRSTEQGKMPNEFKKPKGFFCSSLVGYSYQLAEGRPLVKKLLNKERFCKGALAKRIQANVLAIRHRSQLNQKMKFKIDPKRSTPSDLYSWISSHKELFTSIQSYQQPSKATA